MPLRSASLEKFLNHVGCISCTVDLEIVRSFGGFFEENYVDSYEAAFSLRQRGVEVAAQLIHSRPGLIWYLLLLEYDRH
jgi:hypothetical protein